MSMPSFPNPSEIPTIEQAIAAIIASIAMEETALSHVIDAESQKIKFAVECAKEKGCTNSNIKELLAVNKSAHEVLKSIADLQITLKEKLDTAVKYMPNPPTPPTPSCVPKFVTQPGYIWHSNGSLFLMDKKGCKVESEPCGNGIRLIRRNCESMILLPRGKKFEILLELEAVNKNHCPTKIKMEFRYGKDVAKTVSFDHDGQNIKISRRIPFEAPMNEEEISVIVKLLSPESLSYVVGVVTIFMET